MIVNKYHGKLFGSGLKKSDAEQLLRDWLAGFIPDSPDLVQEAINRGLPISCDQPVQQGGKSAGAYPGSPTVNA